MHCDYVTNILQKEMILGIPDQVIFYNSLSVFPQSYRYYQTYPLRAVATSILHREVLLYLIIFQFIYSVINGFNVFAMRHKERSFSYLYISWSYFIYTIYNNITVIIK